MEYEGAQLTYGELNRRANQLAHYLRTYLGTQGVSSETLVGVCMERSLEMVIALLGILKAGGAYVPLDPAYPKERLAFMLEDAQVGVLLTRDGLIPGLSCAKTVRMDADADEIARQSDANPMGTAGSTSLAYVIYTSGSTGQSKGVQIAHRSVVNFLTSMRQQPGLTEEDVLLSVTTLSFDIAALEIFLPLTVGARLVLVSREVASDGARLSERLAKSGATVMQATPATWRLLLEAGWRGSRRLKILCGGEALDRELADQLLKKCAALWNLYGPTETTIWSATYKVGSESASNYGPNKDRPGSHRPANCQHAALPARPPFAACACGGHGRTAHRRGWLGPRLPEPARTDGREVHSQSLRRELGRPAAVGPFI